MVVATLVAKPTSASTKLWLGFGVVGLRRLTAGLDASAIDAAHGLSLAAGATTIRCVVEMSLRLRPTARTGSPRHEHVLARTSFGRRRGLLRLTLRDLPRLSFSLRARDLLAVFRGGLAANGGEHVRGQARAHLVARRCVVTTSDGLIGLSFWPSEHRAIFLLVSEETKNSTLTNDLVLDGPPSASVPAAAGFAMLRVGRVAYGVEQSQTSGALPFRSLQQLVADLGDILARTVFEIPAKRRHRWLGRTSRAGLRWNRTPTVRSTDRDKDAEETSAKPAAGGRGTVAHGQASHEDRTLATPKRGWHRRQVLPRGHVLRASRRGRCRCRPSPSCRRWARVRRLRRHHRRRILLSVADSLLT